MDGLTSKQVICSVGNNEEPVGTDALGCPPIYPYVSSRQATSSPFEGLGEAFAGCVLADRRGRLSLQVGNSFNGRRSLTPVPSPNGEGRKRSCLHTKWCIVGV